MLPVFVGGLTASVQADIHWVIKYHSLNIWQDPTEKIEENILCQKIVAQSFKKMF